MEACILLHFLIRTIRTCPSLPLLLEFVRGSRPTCLTEFLLLGLVGEAGGMLEYGLEVYTEAMRSDRELWSRAVGF